MKSRLNINHGDAETQSFDELTGKVICACIRVHRERGPSLLESATSDCSGHELNQAGLSFEQQTALPVFHKGKRLDCGCQMDTVIERRLIPELETVDHLLPIHEAQMLACLRISNLSCGLIHFNVPVLKQGIKRLVNCFSNTSVSPVLHGTQMN